MRVISRFDFELHNPPTRQGITHSYGNLSAGRRPQGGRPNFIRDKPFLPFPLNVQWAEYLFPQSIVPVGPLPPLPSQRRKETDLLLLGLAVTVLVVFGEIFGVSEE